MGAAGYIVVIQLNAGIGIQHSNRRAKLSAGSPESKEQVDPKLDSCGQSASVALSDMSLYRLQ